jgi:hypothetical protein
MIIKLRFIECNTTGNNSGAADYGYKKEKSNQPFAARDTWLKDREELYFQTWSAQQDRAR